MDALLDGDFDLVFEDGDFSTGDNTQQRLYLILDSEPGGWKQSPTVGVGIQGMLNGALSSETLREIQLQLASDGLKLSKADYKNGNLGIEK
jgi:hypothetical protein